MRRHPERDIRRRRNKTAGSVSPSPAPRKATQRDSSVPSTGWVMSNGESEFAGWRLAYNDRAQQDENESDSDAGVDFVVANRRRRQVFVVQAATAGAPRSAPSSAPQSAAYTRKSTAAPFSSSASSHNPSTQYAASRTQGSSFRVAPNVPVESMRLIEIASKGAIVNQHLHRLTCGVCDDSTGKLDLGKAFLIVDELSATSANAAPSAAQLVYAIRIRLAGPREPNRMFLCLNLLEMCVKNLGLNFARFIDQELMDAIIKCFKMTSFRNRSLASQVNKSMQKLVTGLDTFGMPSDPRIHVMRQKILFLIQLWADAFMLHQDEVPVIHSAYRNLREKGIVFPNRDANQKFFVKDAEESPAFDVSAYGASSSHVPSVDPPAAAKASADKARLQSRDARNAPDPRFTVSVDDILALQRAVDLLSEPSPKAPRSDLKAAFRLVRLSVTPLRRYKAKLANVIVNSADDSAELQDYVETYSTLCALLSSAELIVEKSRALKPGPTARDQSDGDAPRSRSVPPQGRPTQPRIENLPPPPESPSAAVAAGPDTKPPKRVDLIDLSPDEPEDSQPAVVQQSRTCEGAVKGEDKSGAADVSCDSTNTTTASFATNFTTASNVTTAANSWNTTSASLSDPSAVKRDGRRVPAEVSSLVNVSVSSTALADTFDEATMPTSLSAHQLNTTTSVAQLVVEDLFTADTHHAAEAVVTSEQSWPPQDSEDNNREGDALSAVDSDHLRAAHKMAKADPLGSLWLEFAKS